MTDKDPKYMTSSELVRWAVSSTGVRCDACEKMGLGCSEENDGSCSNTRDYIADRVDAELAEARDESLRQGAMVWAKANGWPDFRDGEDFGAWLDRCALPRPRFDDGEPVQQCDEWKAIMMSLDGSRFQLLKSYPDGLCFTGSPVKRPDPDTQERIDEDARKRHQSYWGCEGRSCKVCPAIIDGANPCERYGVCSCSNAKTLDLLRRQRELDARKGGAE